MPGMNGRVLYNLPAVVMHELVAEGGNINGKGQDEDSGNSLPGREGGSVGGGVWNCQTVSISLGCQGVVAEPAQSASHPWDARDDVLESVSPTAALRPANLEEIS